MDVANVVTDPRLLHVTTAVPVNNGVIGNTGGAANDTRLVSVLLLLNAGPAKLTIAGFRGEDGVARSIQLTGSATADTYYTFPGLKNSAGAMTLTASVADTALVGVMPG